jgi:cytochrome c oxidase cbb3-type subunit 3
MSSRFLSLSAALISAAVALTGCDRERRESRGTPLPETASHMPETTVLFPGGSVPPPPDGRAADYEGNAYQIGEGQRLYSWMNCVGCHSHGGGGMGPALMDDQWRYGGRMDQIVATIAQGRPNGMPSFSGKMTPQQMWQVAAYVRAMSGQAPKDAVPSRGDEPSNTEPLTQTDQEKIMPSDPAAVQGTSP